MKTYSLQLSLLLALLATTSIHATTIALLPIQQRDIHPNQRLSDETVYHALIEKLTQLPEVHPLPFQSLVDTCRYNMIDNAVFEVLVTGELHQTLATMTTWDQEIPWSQKLSRLNQICEADYLVDVTINPVGKQWHIAYTLIDPQSHHPLCAKTITEVNNDPLTVSQEIAKTITRSLWQVRHNVVAQNKT